MRMNVFEMEGFLRGRCVPRDLKVNETDAEYLVRKFDALEAKCAAQENKVIPVSTELPPANESVLLFDANGEGWLSCSERMPSEEDVLVYCSDTKEQMVGFHKGKGLFQFFYMNGVEGVCEPSHWMTLPEPPL